MRRFAFLVMAVVAAACGVQEAQVGEQTVKIATPSSPDTLLARAAAELTQLGFTIGGREGNMIFTVPRPLSDAASSAGAANMAGTANQLWFVHFVADSRMFRSGTNGTVRGYLVPRTGAPSPGNVVQENAQQITSERVAAFRELRRVAERLNVAANRGF